MMTTTNSTA